MEQNKGRVTIPTDLDVIPQTLEIMEQWGADAIRDCDGTDFPKELCDVDAKIYSTYYTTRKDNKWAMENPEEIQQMYVMTPFYTADGAELEDPADEGALSGYVKAQHQRRYYPLVGGCGPHHRRGGFSGKMEL